MDTKTKLFISLVFLTMTALAAYTYVMYGPMFSIYQVLETPIANVEHVAFQLMRSAETKRPFKRRTLVSMNKSSSHPRAKQYPHYFVSKPLGRLGNQMFEFASSLGIARSLNYTHVVRPSHALLKVFQLSKASSVNITNIMHITEGQWRNKNWRAKRMFMSFNLTLYGYFQSRKFFENASVEVRKAFTIKQKFTQQAKAFLDANIPSKNKTIIGIHVRRGDFLNDVEMKLGRVVASSYYFKQAKMYFKRKYKDLVFVVISNDIKWCKENIADNNTIFSTFKTPIIDMALMTLSHHMITSSGTFSWWCGWFCKGTVIYMKDHPRPGSQVSREPKFIEGFYLPSWIGMGNS